MIHGVANAQNTETSTPSSLVRYRYDHENSMSFVPGKTSSSTESGGGSAQHHSLSAGSHERRRSQVFSELPDISADQLASIPDSELDPTQKRTWLIEQEALAGLPDNEKYSPARASALEMADFPTLKIQALAHQLNGNPMLIYKYVRDQIRTENQPKANKGAHMTLVLGSGGAGDKALLLYSLFRASGKLPGDEIRYINARVKLPIVTKFCFSLSGFTGWGPQDVAQGLPNETEIQSLKDGTEFHRGKKSCGRG